MKFLALSALFAIIFTGCASTNLNTVTSKKDIQKVDKAYAKCLDDENSKRLESAINAKLKAQNIYGDTLLIECEALSYNEGNRALRYIVGFGAGKASLESRAKFINNNILIDEVRMQSNLSISFLGGSVDEIFEDSAKKLIEYANKNFIEAR